MPRLYRILTVLLGWWIAPACFAVQSAWYFTPSDVNALHSKPPSHQLYYGNDSLQVADLRLPNTPGPYPVAIIIHGGCWMSKFANMQNTSALADALRDMGIATWNIEYRRVDNNGGGWPGTFADVAHAADYLKQIAGKYNLDLHHVIAIGHSAGGHLALWLAGRHRLSPDSQLYMRQPIELQGAIVLGGVPDLKAFRQQGENICGADVVGQLLGNLPAKMTQRYKETSPIELLPLGVPQVFIYGVSDQAVPEKFSHAYMSVAKEKGDSVKLVTVKHAAHHEYNVPNSVSWEAVRAAVLSLTGLSKASKDPG